MIRTERRKLKNMVTSHNSVPEQIVSRKTKDLTGPLKVETILSCDLVIGDILVLNNEQKVVPCDCVLISGNVIVDEGMLTGESAPVTKVTPSGKVDEILSMKKHKQYILFCGTSVLQTRSIQNRPVLAKVVRTGYYSAKGQLVRSILYPQPINIQLQKDSLKFILKFAQLAVLGFVYSLAILYLRGEPVKEIIIKALDLITVVVPPALPAATSVGLVYAMKRLKRQKIFCIAPSRIDVAGQVDVVCFDKTGTLTEDGLQLEQTIITENSCEMNEISKLCMASCHTLTNINGRVQGDTLDLEMFKESDYDLVEPENNTDQSMQITILRGIDDPGMEFGYVKKYPFTSEAQRMVVVIKPTEDNTHTELYPQDTSYVVVKGAPEKIAALCQEVPPDFYEILNKYTKQGFRVLAMGYKKTKLSWLNIQKKQREEIEKNIKLVGFLLFKNNLKPETTPVIKTLHAARIRTVMITGDNIDTAIAVARGCGIIKDEQNVYRARIDQTEYQVQLKWEAMTASTIPSRCSTPELDKKKLGRGVMRIFILIWKFVNILHNGNTGN